MEKFIEFFKAELHKLLRDNNVDFTLSHSCIFTVKYLKQFDQMAFVSKVLNLMEPGNRAGQGVKLVKTRINGDHSKELELFQAMLDMDFEDFAIEVRCSVDEIELELFGGRCHSTMVSLRKYVVVPTPIADAEKPTVINRAICNFLISTGCIAVDALPADSYRILAYDMCSPVHTRAEWLKSLMYLIGVDWEPAEYYTVKCTVEKPDMFFAAAMACDAIEIQLHTTSVTISCIVEGIAYTEYKVNWFLKDVLFREGDVICNALPATSCRTSETFIVLKDFKLSEVGDEFIAQRASKHQRVYNLPLWLSIHGYLRSVNSRSLSATSSGVSSGCYHSGRCDIPLLK